MLQNLPLCPLVRPGFASSSAFEPIPELSSLLVTVKASSFLCAGGPQLGPILQRLDSFGVTTRESTIEICGERPGMLLNFVRQLPNERRLVWP